MTALSRRSDDTFWGDISPCDHSVQVYDDEGYFLDALESFVRDGLRRGEAAVVIATSTHHRRLAWRLRAQGVDVDAALADDRFIPLDAAATLQRFMRDGWPDDALFVECVRDILSRGRAGGRHVRAFGEMVSLLWEDGLYDATIHLEQLWSRLCREESLSLFCAYPRSAFTRETSESVRAICAAHRKVVGRARPDSLPLPASPLTYPLPGLV